MPEHKPQELNDLRAKLEALIDVILKPQERNSLRTKLKAFTDVILEQAEQNPDFLIQLEAVLSGDFAVSQTKETKRKRKKISFDAVAYLSDHSADDLKRYLLDQEEADLLTIAKQEGLKSLPKKLTREEVASRIVEFVSKTLYQGSSFLKDSPEVQQSSDSAQPTQSAPPNNPIQSDQPAPSNDPIQSDQPVKLDSLPGEDAESSKLPDDSTS